MASKCFYCRTDVTEHDSIPVIAGAKTELVCIACDDRIVAYSREEETDEYGSSL